MCLMNSMRTNFIRKNKTKDRRFQLNKITSNVNMLKAWTKKNNSRCILLSFDSGTRAFYEFQAEQAGKDEDEVKALFDNDCLVMVPVGWPEGYRFDDEPATLAKAKKIWDAAIDVGNIVNSQEKHILEEEKRNEENRATTKVDKLQNLFERYQAGEFDSDEYTRLQQEVFANNIIQRQMNEMMNVDDEDVESDEQSNI